LISFCFRCHFLEVLRETAGTARLHLDHDGRHALQIGFQIDRLTALMMVVVTFVSLMVHVYTIGYMAEDPATSASSATSRCSPSRC
jgi:NADH:ubiquinone oxidoreductase subunit 5 (subunit L)/multisubunit Na+/H+ antiporter MnhA subunit